MGVGEVAGGWCGGWWLVLWLMGVGEVADGGW